MLRNADKPWNAPALDKPLPEPAALSAFMSRLGGMKAGERFRPSLGKGELFHQAQGDFPASPLFPRPESAAV